MEKKGSDKEEGSHIESHHRSFDDGDDVAVVFCDAGSLWLFDFFFASYSAFCINQAILASLGLHITMPTNSPTFGTVRFLVYPMSTFPSVFLRLALMCN